MDLQDKVCCICEIPGTDENPLIDVRTYPVHQEGSCKRELIGSLDEKGSQHTTAGGANATETELD